MKGAEFVVSDDWADVIEGEVYDSSVEAYDYIADAVPSIDDLRSEFCAEFSRGAPGCEISNLDRGGRGLLVKDADGNESLIRYRKVYAKARVDMEVVYAGGPGKVEHVRGACLLAARKVAATIADMSHVGSPFVPGGKGASSVRWIGGGPLHWPGSSYTGRPRVAVEFNRDAVLVLLASYFVLVPAGCTVVEPELEQ